MDLPTWFETASKQELISGVGCPFCRYSGPYWVEGCEIHRLIHDLVEDKSILQRIVDDQSETLNAIREKLGLDPEDDPVPHIDDLIIAGVEA